MDYKLNLIIVAAFLVVAVAADNAAKIKCIHEKHQGCLGNQYTLCHNRSRALNIEKIKVCYRESMETANVITTTGNDKKIHRQRFGEYAQQNEGCAVGAAMKACFDENSVDSPMYNEPARGSQCVFEKIKKKCP